MKTLKYLKRFELMGIATSILALSGFFLVSAAMSGGKIIAGLLMLSSAVLFFLVYFLTDRAEKAFLEKNYWYEQIIDLWENPLSITDMDMNWTFVNKTVENLLGKSRAEIIGQQCNNWGANICNTDDCGVNCLRRGKEKTFFYQWETDFRVNTHYLHNLQGERIGHIEIVTNIDSQKQLNRLIKNVKNIAANVAAGIQQLSNSAQTLSTGATEQASSTEEISSSMNEVEAQTKLNRDNASQAQQVSDQTRKTIQKGNSQMEVMVQSMKTINNTSSEVSKVIKVIDEIAFQTNLLALNAAVEAARAGKYGKGFAVVADEVRALAGRSAEAAKDTTELIEKSIKGVESGVQNADETAKILADIIHSVEKMNDLLSEIAAGSIEQTTSIEEVNNGLAQVNAVVQQNASISEENASAAEELKAQVRQLVKTTEGIRISEDIGEEESEKKEVTPQPEPVIDPEVITQPEEVLATRKPNKLITLDDSSFGKY